MCYYWFPCNMQPMASKHWCLIWSKPVAYTTQFSLISFAMTSKPAQAQGCIGGLLSNYHSHEWVAITGQGVFVQIGPKLLFCCNCGGQTNRGGKVMSEMQLLAVWQQRHNFFWSFDSFKMLHSFLFVRTFIVGGWDSDKYFGIAVVAREDCRWVIGVAN